MPSDPTVTELAGDAWQELSGYDGRIAATLRGILRPGFLTNEYIRGRRAHYLPPVRVYLTVSVIYFLLSAGAPQLPSPGVVTGPGGLRISVSQTGDRNGIPMTDADRAELLKDLERAPWFLKPMLKATADDPAAFRARIFTVMPRVFFALLPVFAAIVAVFYRGRRFPTALVFAVHVHAFAYLIFAVSEAAKYSGIPILAAVVAFVATITFAIYALRSLRAVFGGSWPKTIAKAAGIGVVYLFAAIPAFFIMLVWASLT